MTSIARMNAAQLRAAILETCACSGTSETQSIGARLPQLLARGNALLALSGMALPSTEAHACGPNAFSHLMAVDPRVASGAVSGRAHDSYWSPTEEAQNVRETYGPASARLYTQAEQTFGRSQLAVLLALSGASQNDLVNVLGPDNPGSLALAKSLQSLVHALSQQPVDFAAVHNAMQLAHWQMIGHAATSPKDRAMAEAFFREYYGISKPQAGTYRGRGPLGGTVESHGGSAPRTGEFVTKDSSQAGLAALRAAQSQVGVRETSGRNDGVPSQRYAGGRMEPWCADFVTWTFQQSGHPLPGNQRSNAGVSYMEGQLKKAGKFHTGTPKAGDIIFFANRGRSDRGSGRHVGIVEKVENGRVYTIEGNSSNAVRRRSYPLNAARISGYGRA